MTGGWRPTRALGRATLVGMVLVVAGATLGRGDVAVLGVPLLGAALWSVATRPRRAPGVRSTVDRAVVQEGEDFTWRLDVTQVAGLRDVAAHLPGDRWARTTPAHGHVASAATGDGTDVPVAVRLTAERWGVRRLGPAQLAAFSDLAGYAWVWPVQQTETVTVVPAPGDFTSRSGLPHPVGLVGQHRSSRPGGGTELSDIRPFRTGDRLRRIHWPVSLRTGTLHVTTTYADQDAEVSVVVDGIRDLGHRDPTTGRRTSLDIAVEGAGAIAAHYLSTGDRVGLSVLGGGGAVEIPAVGGHHQLARIVVGLGRAEPARGTLGEDRAVRAQIGRAVRPGAVVVLLSALVSPVTLGHAVRLSRSGHDVIVIDTLPPELADADISASDAQAVTGAEDPRLARLVWRLRLLEREREARRCAAAGVPVIRWQGAGSLDAVLRGVGRRRRAPQAVSR